MESIFMGMACQPQRFSNIPFILKRVLPQIDKLFVYINGGKVIPELLKNNPKIVYELSTINKGSNMKFWGVNKIDKGYFFCVDDDVFLAVDHVKRMIDTMQKYDNKIITCLHSHTFDFTSSKVWPTLYIPTPFYCELKKEQRVIFPGTGSFGFHFPEFSFTPEDEIPYMNMDDTLVGIKAMKEKVKIYSIARPENYVGLLSNGGVSIWGHDPVNDIEKVIDQNRQELVILNQEVNEENANL